MYQRLRSHSNSQETIAAPDPFSQDPGASFFGGPTYISGVKWYFAGGIVHDFTYLPSLKRDLDSILERRVGLRISCQVSSVCGEEESIGDSSQQSCEEYLGYAFLDSGTCLQE